jgi:tellurite resistance protein
MRERQATRPPIPASLFGIPVGVLGLANAWNVGARIWHLPPIVGAALAAAGSAVWLVLLVLYVQKWLRHRAEAQREAHDPVQSSFVALLFVSTMLVSADAAEVSRQAAAVLFGISAAAQLALGVWLLGRTWQGGHGADFPTPALYLPGVGQSFVAANCAALFGWPQLGAWLFGCGVFSWVALESIVLGRAATRDPVPPGLRPALGVQLAPPVVGGLAYLSLTAGTPDLAAHMLFGYGLYQAALLLRLWGWIRQPSFSPGYWAFSFGVTALPTMAMRMVERGDSGPMTWVAPVLFASANVIIAWLAVASLRLVAQGKLVPRPIVLPETAAASTTKMEA